MNCILKATMSPVQEGPENLEPENMKNSKSVPRELCFCPKQLILSLHAFLEEQRKRKGGNHGESNGHHP